MAEYEFRGTPGSAAPRPPVCGDPGPAEGTKCLLPTGHPGRLHQVTLEWTDPEPEDPSIEGRITRACDAYRRGWFSSPDPVVRVSSAMNAFINALRPDAEETDPT